MNILTLRLAMVVQASCAMLHTPCTSHALYVCRITPAQLYAGNAYFLHGGRCPTRNQTDLTSEYFQPEKYQLSLDKTLSKGPKDQRQTDRQIHT